MKRLLHVLRLALLAASCAAAAPAVFAHATSTAYLEVGRAEAVGLPLRWIVALRDLDVALDLDADADGRLTWGEVSDRRDRIDELARGQIEISAAASRCDVEYELPRFARVDGTGHVVLAGRATCPQPPALVQVRYRFLERFDPSHRVLVRVAGDGSPRALAPGGQAELTPQAGDDDAPAQARAGFTALLADGIAHIAGGPDHLLFLVALLLPAVLIRKREGWLSRPVLRPALIDVAWIVTAFTLAHSVTLALASFGIVRIPARVIEPLIALTVLAAALNNLWPLVTKRLAWVAFGFGLIHGFGFAEVLAPLGLGAGDLALALLGFNLGVEAGQLAIVALVFAALALARRWSGYPRWVLRGGSAVLAVVACAWIVERVFDVPVFALALAAR